MILRHVVCFAALLSVCVGYIHAAPLESGFKNAPSASAYPAEKAAAYRDARLRVIAAAETYERTPYRYGGLDRRGLDCSGLVYLSFQDALGVAVPRNTWGLYSWVDKISLEEAVPGDLVFFNTTGNGPVSHVGIFLGDRRFIHAASDGPSTGVIYSTLDERYWSRTYVGMGRVFPETDTKGFTGKPNAKTEPKPAPPQKPAAEKRPAKSRSSFMMGISAAPTWNLIYGDDEIFRGIAGQIQLSAAVKPFGLSMLFGLELRPEWDRALGVFRLPLTLSWGVNDKVRIFAGPVLSVGDAALSVAGEERHYEGGTAWLGTAGITVAPFSFKIAKVQCAPYGELAWQSYQRRDTNAGFNFNTDVGAALRFSTGLRFTWQI